MLPTCKSGTNSRSGSPATFESIPFVLAESMEMALSNPKGPSIMVDG